MRQEEKDAQVDLLTHQHEHDKDLIKTQQVAMLHAGIAALTIALGLASWSLMTSVSHGERLSRLENSNIHIIQRLDRIEQSQQENFRHIDQKIEKLIETQVNRKVWEVD